MKINPLIEKRFDELIKMGGGVLATRQNIPSSRNVIVMLPDYVDTKVSEEWSTSCISFIGKVMGKDSEHYQRFKQHYEHISQYSHALKAFSVLQSAFDEYKGGYIFDITARIRAEVFDDLLEQAESLVSDNYYYLGAVVAGCVLEDTMRKICSNKGITLPDSPKLDWMNSELAKINVYDKLVQKRVTYLADIRNKAAHGKWTEFKKEDVVDMISSVRRFVEDYS